jgi:hypothetical protein
MLELEKSIQERFLNNLFNSEKKFDNTQIKTYQRLVLMRYYEVIKNSFPLFVDFIEERELEQSISLFIKTTATTPFVWQMPKEYIGFVKKNKIFNDKKFLYELLTYDFIEIELYKKSYNINSKSTFSYDKQYKFSKNAKIKRFEYDIIGKKFKNKRENFVITYYDFDSNEVIYREINPLMYLILKKLSEKKTLNKILKELCFKHEIDFKEAKKVLESPLKELFEKKIFFN